MSPREPCDVASACEARLDYLHSETKATREKTIGLDVRVDQHEASLAKSAERFAQLDNLVRPAPLVWWKVLLALMTVAVPVAGMAAMVFRAPTRDEFRELQRDVQAIREQQAATTILLQTLLSQQRSQP